MIEFTEDDREVLMEASEILKGLASDDEEGEKLAYLAGRLAGLAGRVEGGVIVGEA